MTEKEEIAVLEFNNANDMVEIKNNPVVKIILDLLGKIPIVGYLSDILDGIIDENMEAKKEELLRVIVNSDIKSEEIDIAFITEFMNIYDCIIKIRSNDKVDIVKKLFKNAICNDNMDYDEYKEFLSKINELSMREIKLLEILSGERILSSHREGAADSIKQYESWEWYLEDASGELNLSKEDIHSITAGIIRTGFCKLTVLHNKGIPYCTYEPTDYYLRLKQYLYS